MELRFVDSLEYVPIPDIAIAVNEGLAAEVLINLSFSQGGGKGNHYNPLIWRLAVGRNASRKRHAGAFAVIYGDLLAAFNEIHPAFTQEACRIPNVFQMVGDEDSFSDSKRDIVSDNLKACSVFSHHQLNAVLGGFGRTSRSDALPRNDTYTYCRDNELPALYPLEYCVPLWRSAIGAVGMVCGILFGLIRATRSQQFSKFFSDYAVFVGSGVFWLTGEEPCKEYQRTDSNHCNGAPSFHTNNVTQKLLTMLDSCNTLIAVGRTQMANTLSTDKQGTIIGLLAEGSSIRSIEHSPRYHHATWRSRR